MSDILLKSAEKIQSL